MSFSLKLFSSRCVLAALPALALLGCGGASDGANGKAAAGGAGAVAAASSTALDAGAGTQGTTTTAAVAVASTSRPQLPMPAQMVGVTIDSTSRINDIVTSLKSLSKVPTTRIVFDEFVPAADYRDATVAVRNVSYVMGELLDSFYVKQYTVQQYLDRQKEYLSVLGDVVDLWEVGNEINGEWLGNTADVVAKMSGAYDLVKAQGKMTELTLYYNKDCWSKPSNEMFTWAKNNIPQRMKDGLDYVLISYYEDDCNNLQPDWPTVFRQLRAMFPNSKIGFGEVGTTNTAKKAAYINRYYTKNITEPGYVGGYFWWYFRQDMVPMTKTLWATLNTAISKMPTFTPLQSAAPAPAPAPAPEPVPTTTTSTVSTAATAWTTQYNGYGNVTYSATSGIVMAPQVSTQPSETHAALTLARLPKMRNFRASMTVTTEQQLRLNSPPNPWEVFWLFFNYNPTATGKNTNYFILKPNGVELGVAQQQLAQTFLQTGAAPAPAVGVANKIGTRVRVWVNGMLAIDRTGGLIDVEGSLGLYAEDARVRIAQVQVTQLP